MQNLLNTILTVLTSLTIVSCDQAIPKLVPVPDVIPEAKVDLGTDETTTFRPKVDILFVIDDSGSMGSHQQKLASNISLFINAIKADPLLDYNIGVTTSDDGSSIWGSSNVIGGALVNKGGYTVVNPLTPSLDTVLSKNLIVGTNGSADEKFLNIVEMALTPPVVSNQNRNFYRPDAAIAIIFITDTDDQSRTSAQDLYDFLVNGLKNGDPSKVFAYAALAEPAYPSCFGESMRTTKIIDFVNLVGGNHFSLCSTTFGQEFAKFGQAITEGISNVIYLSAPPIVNTIQVIFDGKLIPADIDLGWSFDPSRNAIVLGKDLDLDYKNATPGSQIEVKYKKAEYDKN